MDAITRRCDDMNLSSSAVKTILFRSGPMILEFTCVALSIFRQKHAGLSSNKARVLLSILYNTVKYYNIVFVFEYQIGTNRSVQDFVH